MGWPSVTKGDAGSAMWRCGVSFFFFFFTPNPTPKPLTSHCWQCRPAAGQWGSGEGKKNSQHFRVLPDPCVFFCICANLRCRLRRAPHAPPAPARRGFPRGARLLALRCSSRPLTPLPGLRAPPIRPHPYLSVSSHRRSHRRIKGYVTNVECRNAACFSPRGDCRCNEQRHAAPPSAWLDVVDVHDGQD
jgi:hypothetical protein